MRGRMMQAGGGGSPHTKTSKGMVVFCIIVLAISWGIVFFLAGLDSNIANGVYSMVPMIGGF